jgi:undecaprenyl diphosphate synthase
MAMLVDTIAKEEETLMKNNIKLEYIGDISQIAIETQNALKNTIYNTRNNTRMTLILALNYSSRWEITQMVKNISKQVKDNSLDIDSIDQNIISKNLSTASYPDPDLLIRTSGEYRLSNYLLWQLAYTELFFTPTLWPDFNKEGLYEAIISFQNRERRFGKTSEQLKK